MAALVGRTGPGSGGRWTGADWAVIRGRIFGRIDPLHEKAVSYRPSGGIDVFLGQARFIGPKVRSVADGELDTTGLCWRQVHVRSSHRCPGWPTFPTQLGHAKLAVAPLCASDWSCPWSSFNAPSWRIACTGFGAYQRPRVRQPKATTGRL
jgi:hypothetical protein